jgi:hypothetical protein
MIASILNWFLKYRVYNPLYIVYSNYIKYTPLKIHMETSFTNRPCQVTNPGALSGDFPNVLARELGTSVGCHGSF